MSEIRKVTVGFVTQRWDAETDAYLGQDFTCGDDCTYEDENGEVLEEGSFNEPNYETYDMVQPKNNEELRLLLDQVMVVDLHSAACLDKIRELLA